MAALRRAEELGLLSALDRLEGLVVDGLKHGFFDYKIACEVGNGGKRHLVIRAGKSHAGCEWQEIINALGIEASGLFDVRGCGWEARSPNDKKLISVNKICVDAANPIPVEATS